MPSQAGPWIRRRENYRLASFPSTPGNENLVRELHHYLLRMRSLELSEIHDFLPQETTVSAVVQSLAKLVDTGRAIQVTDTRYQMSPPDEGWRMMVADDDDLVESNNSYYSGQPLGWEDENLEVEASKAFKNQLQAADAMRKVSRNKADNALFHNAYQRLMEAEEEMICALKRLYPGVNVRTCPKCLDFDSHEICSAKNVRCVRCGEYDDHDRSMCQVMCFRCGNLGVTADHTSCPAYRVELVGRIISVKFDCDYSEIKRLVKGKCTPETFLAKYGKKQRREQL